MGGFLWSQIMLFFHMYSSTRPKNYLFELEKKEVKKMVHVYQSTCTYVSFSDHASVCLSQFV